MSPRGAVISSCGQYRYSLWRDVRPDEAVQGSGTVVFIMLNPSTADADQDDPTIRRCMGFARSWGYRKLVVVNLFAFRATNPAELLRAPDPVGPLNDHAQNVECSEADLVVCAWGAWNGDRGQRARRVLNSLQHLKLYHLGLTKAGHPKHPLYLSTGILPEPWL